ncbi:ROK family transcriptional regulator [Streptomyces aidingensis]|uniref:Sugar kinase of the NBD/HSP70 family, may contain an N-terminal HTH domain n=1 Tax=Streptomyces aidingensis TaxID=910347 RepID=A0A1I1V8V9_9ACTN|nr:ROK family transcriptional regulator [Streptomyces aidingensis]SFD79427.1 Sugar kinase of the NBD/HSP70 family, may contain an N-terminal HTH domain [Streptomyces aidingensis]
MTSGATVTPRGPAGGARPDTRRRIIGLLRARGPMSRAELATGLGVAKSTVSTLVGRLVEEGVLLDQGPAPSGRHPARGRPRSTVTLNPAMGTAVGLDFGFRHLRAVIADVSHTTLAQTVVDLGVDYHAAEGLDAAAEATATLLETAGRPVSGLLGVGAAVIGPMDLSRGVVTRSSMVPRWDGVAVAGELGDRLAARLPHPVPVTVDNDATCAAYGELLWGAAQGARELLYLKLHSGIGGAVISGGELRRGARGAAGEFGHLSLDPAGPLCRCGSRGCLETYAGIPAVLASLAPMGPDLTIATLIERVRSGDPVWIRALAEPGRRIGQAAGMLCNAFNPDRIVIGGRLADAGRPLLDEIAAGLRGFSLPLNAGVRLDLGTLGPAASALGAVGLVLATDGRPVTANHR